MPIAIRAITRLQDADDFGSTPGAGNDGYVITWDNGTGEFVLGSISGIAGLTPSDGVIIVGDGANFVAESGATARASLGLTIGTDIQAQSANLQDIADLSPGAGNDGEALTWDDGAGAFVLSAAGSSLPVEETTAIAYQTGDVTRTLTLDLSNLTAARSYAVPDASDTLAVLGQAQTFTAEQTLQVSTRFEYGPGGSAPTDGIRVRRHLADVGGTSTMLIQGTAWNSTTGLVAYNHGAKNKFEFKDCEVGFTYTGGIAINVAVLGASGSDSIEDALWVTASGGNVYAFTRTYAASTYPNLIISAPSIDLRTKVGAGWNNGDGYGTTRLKILDTGLVAVGSQTPTAKLHVDQDSTTAAIPVITLDQADVDQVLAKIIGTSSAASVDRTLVKAADYATPGSIAGWIQIAIQDDRAGGITAGDYYIPFYAAPS